MGLLARRNLFHDGVRFTVTLTGIVFALVLIIIQFGLFLGFTTTTSNNIDHSNADLWVVFTGSDISTLGIISPNGKFTKCFQRREWRRPRSTCRHLRGGRDRMAGWKTYK